MSTVLKLEDCSASDLLRTLVGLKTAKIIQVLPMSEIRPNETRDYLVIYEQIAAAGPDVPLVLDDKAQAAAYVDGRIMPVRDDNDGIDIASARHSSDKFLNLADVLRTLQECTAGSLSIRLLLERIHDGEIGLPTYEQIAAAGPAAAGKPGPTM